MLRTLADQKGTHDALLNIFREVWPRFAAASADTLRRVLTGSTVQTFPPVRCSHFLESAAGQRDLPPGLRLFLIIGTTLAITARTPEEINFVGANELETAGSACELQDKFLRTRRAHETLRMPHRLRTALCGLVCSAVGQAESKRGRAAIQGLLEGLLFASADLLSPAPPVLLSSQLDVGHVLAEADATRRVVVAARSAVHFGKYASASYANDVGMNVEVIEDTTGSATRYLSVFLDLQSAADENPIKLNVCLGLIADSEVAVRELSEAAAHWCRGGSPQLEARRGLWTSRPIEPFEIGTEGVGRNRAFGPDRYKGVGYKLAGGEQVIAFACCEWPAPAAAAREAAAGA